MRQQRDPRRHAEAAHLFGGQQGDFGDLLGGRIGVVMRVADEELMLGKHQHLHDGERPDARAQSDHIADRSQVIPGPAEHAAQHRVAFAALQERGREQRTVVAHLRQRERARDAVALSLAA